MGKWGWGGGRGRKKRGLELMKVRDLNGEGPLSIWCWDQEEDQEIWKEAKGIIITAIFLQLHTVFEALDIYYLLHLNFTEGL